MIIVNYFHETTTIIKGTAKTKIAVFEELSALLVKNNLVNNQQQLLQDLEKREKEGATGVDEGIAIPPCSSSSVIKPTIAIMTLASEINWQSLDNKPADLIFMIVTPPKGGEEHLQTLSQLAMFLTNKDTINQIRNATSYQELINAFQIKASPAADNLAPNQHYDVIGITACPTGIAHTYMAKEKLE